MILEHTWVGCKTGHASIFRSTNGCCVEVDITPLWLNIYSNTVEDERTAVEKCDEEGKLMSR